MASCAGDTGPKQLNATRPSGSSRWNYPRYPKLISNYANHQLSLIATFQRGFSRDRPSYYFHTVVSLAVLNKTTAPLLICQQEKW